MRFDSESLILDLELTTHCNARCPFCPRDRFERYGRMSFDTYTKVIERVLEMRVHPLVNACGIGGDAAMHPDLVRFVEYATSRGLRFRLVTNGSRIDRALGRALVEAGLSGMEFSINAIDDDYEAFYGLPFETLVENVRAFLEESQGRCSFQINLPRPREHSGNFSREKQFWKALGVERFLKLNYSNQVVLNTQEEAATLRGLHAACRHILQERDLQVLCPIPMKVMVVSWEGHYLLCEHDYTRSSVIGNVFEDAIADVQYRKIAYMQGEGRICETCSVVRDIHAHLTASEGGEQASRQLEDAVFAVLKML